MTATDTHDETRLTCDESAPAAARAVIRALDPGAAVIGDAMLLASELITNAVRHSGCRQDEEITLRAEMIGRGVRIEVRDPAHSGAVPYLAAPDDHFGGMGLRLVEALSDRWGSERGVEQTVWAELRR